VKEISCYYDKDHHVLSIFLNHLIQPDNVIEIMDGVFVHYSEKFDVPTSIEIWDYNAN